MFKDKISAIMTNLAMLLALESYNPNKAVEGIEEKPVEIQADDIEKHEIDLPNTSGPVENLPWQYDEDFLKAQKEYNTPVLMAAFCSVLVEPLPGEEHNVRLAASSVKGILVPPNEIFSQNEQIGPYTKERGYKLGTSFAGPNLVETEGGGVCKIATTLYNVAILSDLEIIERHNHSMPVNYVPYGQDATVAYGYKDFRFRNNKAYPILIWSELIGDRLYIGFYGQEKGPEVEWSHNILNTIEYPTYYRTKPELKEGEKKVVIKGIKGATVESKVIIRYENGEVKTKNLGISSYHPLPEIIEVGEGQN